MKKLLTKFTIFTILGIFFSAYFSKIPHVEARAGHHSSSKDDGTGSIVLTTIAILYYAIYEIRRQKMLKKAKKDLADALKDDSSWNLD